PVRPLQRLRAREDPLRHRSLQEGGRAPAGRARPAPGRPRLHHRRRLRHRRHGGLSLDQCLRQRAAGHAALPRRVALAGRDLQYGHFNVYAPEKIPYAIDRYRKEAERLLGVLDQRLAGRAFITGDDYGIADMAAYPWINVYASAPLDMQPFPDVLRWQAAIAARPATQRAYALSTQVNPDAGKPMSDAQKAVLFGRGTRPA